MEQLKISDLSVGDWVNVMTEKLSSLVFCEEIEITRGYIHSQIKGIREDGFIAVETADSRYTLVDIGCIGPIPIAAEILEKNGWEKLRSGYKCSYGVYDIHIWIKEASVIVTIYEQERILKAVRMQVYSPDMFVHQLQHILRLAGVDKEINL